MLRVWTFVASVLGLCLSSCAVTDQFDDRVARMDIAAEQSRDHMILTNIVRASHAEPLSFVQLGQLNGAATTQGTLGLPPLMFGPHGGLPAIFSDTIFGAVPAAGSGFVGNSATLSGVTSFQATPAETKDFYRGLLQDVEPRTLALFIQQGIARELLFYLFTDKVIEDRNGVKLELRNDPLAPNFSKFQNYVNLAMEYGLSSELLGKATSEEAQTGSKTATGQSDKTRPEHYRLCFNRSYMTSDLPPAGNTPICGVGVKVPGDDRTVGFVSRDGAQIRLQVLPRSTFAIFQYLGRIIAAGERGRIRLSSPEAIDEPPLRDEYLFVVEPSGAADCFINVAYEGQNYCVPRAGATNTKRILGLLAQLLALNTAVEDVPVTPSVRVVQ